MMLILVIKLVEVIQIKH